ncbi:hypothetical protein [Breoghania sp.]|uniref:hypothetical protein n=1 Tax=Breoghania sp. TaxID=2065378 RepID=UPI002606CB3D|nr:hypothetical protein [Breoghania sp.]MDJ0930196.1 hypothetical protein [Breoghania sp.]
MLITSGTEDPISSEEETRKLRGWLEKQRAKIDLMLHDGDKELREEKIDQLRAWIGSFAHTRTSDALVEGA